jgi:osmoprotectant transport system permease protein
MDGLQRYISQRQDTLLTDFVQHALVVALALAIATVLGVGIGLLTWQRPFARSVAIASAGTMLTIPSFALLGLLIPLLGLGWTPTVVALVLYSLLPIVRNTIVGLKEVDPALVEAGRGVGMSSARVLRTIQLPLAWPVILTGIRVSAQLVVGIAAIAAYVAGPGLGNPIFDGLARLGAKNAIDAAIVGTVGVIVLALLFDLFFVVVRRVTTSRGLRV